MIVTKIELSNFRNYDSLSLELDDKTNILYGKNAQGKTNVLEAIYLCSTTKSHRSSKDAELIKFENNEGHIKLFINKKEMANCIDRATLLIKEGDKKPVFLTIKDTEMELSINTFIGSMDESIPIVREGSDMMISFNPKFLIDILRVLDSEEVNIYFTNPKAPCFIRDDENSYIYVVLPVVQ